jgi:hypothetical protein
MHAWKLMLGIFQRHKIFLLRACESLCNSFKRTLVFKRRRKTGKLPTATVLLSTTSLFPSVCALSIATSYDKNNICAPVHFPVTLPAKFNPLHILIAQGTARKTSAPFVCIQVDFCVERRRKLPCP